MVSKVKTCVFISGNGSNLRSIIKSSRDYHFPIKVELVISNNIKANGLNFARIYGIPFKFFSSDNQKNLKEIVYLKSERKKLNFCV